mmetsp:Transcript_63079/g.137059  ORF Transcript_63079/g.137059 Transcript_63079/m.137059 type:complete len:339 (-) Transcript_63079:42-1058(-)
MAFRDDNGFVDRDLMGVHPEELFADPLGIRAGKEPARKEQTERRRPVSPERPRPSRIEVEDDPHENLVPEDENSWGSLLWSFVAGGKQCCSMRDRNRPQDTEAAQRAARTGRPPASNEFPGPAPAAASPSSGAPALPASAQRLGRRDPESDDSDSSRTRIPGQPPRRQAPPSEERIDFASSQQAPVEPRRPEPPSRRENSPPARPAPAAEVPAPPRSLPKRWEWPAWCLNFKQPSIEVYVEDEDTNEARWCQAEPQSRLVDKQGNDAYLCAEYDWDGELYVQDFGPEHVRRRGQKATVAALFAQSVQGSTSSQAPSSRAEMKPRDVGAGVKSFLDDTS